MENATKALIISAAVLIAIVLIAVGIKILSSTQGVTNEVDKVSDAMGKSVFNSQFTDYEGTAVKGSEVREVLNKVAATWRGNSSRNVSAIVNGTTYSSANDIATARASISITSTYTVTVQYDSNGFVSSVTVQ